MIVNNRIRTSLVALSLAAALAITPRPSLSSGIAGDGASMDTSACPPVSLPEPGELHGSTPTAPNWRVSSYRLKDMDIDAAFGEPADPWSQRMNLGLIVPFFTLWADGDEHAKLLSVARDSVTVGDVFDAVTAEDGNFRWEYDGTVFNLLPSSSTKLRLVADVLERRLSRFEVAGVTPGVAEDLLRLQARAEGIESILGLRSYSPEQVLKGRGRELWPSELISIRLEHPTIRQCLNAIAAADPPSGWSASFTSGGIKLTVHGMHAHGPSVPPGPYGKELLQFSLIIKDNESKLAAAPPNERGLYEKILESFRARYRKAFEKNERCLKPGGEK